ncbi:MAG TPA: hypothetical protein VLM43_12390, partial [Desulfobacterales bacterium]|nr:hypothetical protein [Desulfobacterales bacterium]
VFRLEGLYSSEENYQLVSHGFLMGRWVQSKGIVNVFIKIDVHSIADDKIDKTYDLLKANFYCYPIVEQTVQTSRIPVLSVREKDPNIIRTVYLRRPKVSMMARYRFTSLFLT